MMSKNLRLGSRSSIISVIASFMSLNDCRDIDKIQKLKIVCTGIKLTLYLFTGAFVGLVVRGKVVLPPVTNRML